MGNGALAIGSGGTVSALLSDSRGRSGHRTDGESGNRRPAPVRQIEDRWCASWLDGETHLKPATPSISRATSPNADGEVRTVLYEAASSMPVRSKQRCRAKAWGRIAATRGHKRAVVAAARKLAVIMHRMWLDGSEFRLAASDGHENSTGAGKTTALAAAC